MDDINSLLSEISDWMDKNFPEWLGNLKPGLSLTAIDEIERQLLPYRLPLEVKLLYQWRNGQSNFWSEFIPEFGSFFALDDFQCGCCGGGLGCWGSG